MILIGSALGTVRRLRPAPRVTLCGYLGCGERATRIALDRLCNRVPACGNPDHGKEIPK